MNDSEHSDLKERETMKILLTTLNSKYVHMNLAVRYLYESAIEYKDQIQIKEFTINNDDDYIFTELVSGGHEPVSYTHLRAHETRHDIVCRLLLEKKKKIRSKF